MTCPTRTLPRVSGMLATLPAEKTQEIAMKKYLFLQRSTPAPDVKREPPSPEQMQQMFASFTAWKDKFAANIVDMGGKLKSGGQRVTSAGVIDGPMIEAKELIGGYMIVVAETYELALEVAKESPGAMMPGSSIEIREISTS